MPPVTTPAAQHAMATGNAPAMTEVRIPSHLSRQSECPIRVLVHSTAPILFLLLFCPPEHAYASV